MEIKHAIQLIRRGLGRPHDAMLGDHEILTELWEVLSYYRSILNISHEAWSLKRYDFFADAGERERQIAVSDYSQGIFIRSKDETNPYFIERTIDIVKPENMGFYISGFTNLQTGGSWWTPHVARVFSVFYENSQWKIKWFPIHQTSAEYTLWYIQGASNAPPLYDVQMGFPIEEASFLIVNQCIVNLFPHLADEEIGLNAKQLELQKTAQTKLTEYQPLLDQRRWDGPHQEPMQHRKIFGHRRSGPNRFF